MTLRHPFGWLAEPKQGRALTLLIVITLAVMAALLAIGKPLKTSAAPAGIVSFEFAGEPAAARQMMQSWGPRGQIYAGLSLGLDFLFLVTYASAIALGCVVCARVFQPWSGGLATLGAILAWAQIPAALCDAVENIALIQVLLGSQAPIWPTVAYGCAIPKFAIVALGLTYLVGGGLAYVGVQLKGR